MMILNDVCTVYWKEHREWVAAQRSTKSRWVTAGVLVAIVGGVLPYQLHTLWTTSVVSILIAMWVMFFRVTNTIADSIAGERERHTLEALVITPLPPLAIVAGKIAAAVRNTGPTMLVAMGVGLIASNWARGAAPWHVYSLPVLSGIILDGGLAGLVAGGVGVLISAHSRTARQAQQTLSILSFLLLIIPSLFTHALHVSLDSFLIPSHPGRLVAVLSLGLIAAAAGLVALISRCARSTGIRV